MSDYTIKKAHYWTPGNNEIEIHSKSLEYSEIGKLHSVCECRNLDNQDKIHKRCIKISKLIKEIEFLNTI